MVSALDKIKEAQELVKSLFEEGEEVEAEEKEKVNKIRRPKGKPENVDIVSVEDELFPYDGTAKQQYNQKIVDKINDVIEGKATLEDLIRLARQRRAYKKKVATSESLNEAIKKVEELVKEYTN